MSSENKLKGWNYPLIMKVTYKNITSKNICDPSLNLKKKLWTGTKKQRVSRQKSFNLFPDKTFIHIMYVCIVSNIKPCQTQLILNCVLL